MSKVLLYVDAENVSHEDLAEVQKVKKCAGDAVFVGKFYGKYDVLQGIMQDCYACGLDYVETSSLNAGKKNLTDMKIVVDCVTDACVLYRGEVQRVVLLSHDCDFIPLVLKLKGCGIVIDMPLFDADRETLTTADLDVFLRDCHYEPMLRDDYLDSQYSVIMGLASEKFDECVIKEYLCRKKKKFLRELGYIADSSQVERLQEDDVSDFSFYRVAEALGIRQVDAFSAKILDLYTRKFYGGSIPSAHRELVLKSALEDMAARTV